MQCARCDAIGRLGARGVRSAMEMGDKLRVEAGERGPAEPLTVSERGSGADLMRLRDSEHLRAQFTSAQSFGSFTIRPSAGVLVM